ncbi:DUF3267 domain-containing protein [Alteribacter populi]|uniref:DUF3267 domain-containing protein n=1 Tax=Alteribacter populi TaxID=2011011 RepID=UPI000BBAC607|nr:DUF3267 domain-containing protein [Alteribacter populi]
MNCWKTVSITQDIGRFRLWFLSGMMMLLYFLLYFLIIRTLFSGVPLVDYGAGFLFICLASVIPTHMFLHCLPIWMVGKKATLGVRTNRWPFLYFTAKQPLAKRLSILAICSPAIFITSGSIFTAIAFPHLLHYTALISAVNVGICMYDFLYFKHIKSAPKRSWIEEYDDGFHILCENPTLNKTEAS